ncbi:GGDEF domain-containing protein [Clostridium cylindrosporum]|uniref:Diguanylate cyclase/phosphodiesterase with PAS/PAC sensor(S) n=1 Tax=Clostridium cylindrosporum DSM 605 TaxID=1121307 RepID=A0A0J8DCN8_CLOCY|nr:GGDEF domain-containing protein [Clostridium cylindrosporum]KMT22019.1 diguanylate cyclase/phosphodiesterase with PAS/PAC sensor(S) [Clostridium cylindrosporum DSM 605]
MKNNNPKTSIYASMALYIVLYYLWITFFNENLYFNFISNIFQTIPLLVAAACLIYTYKKECSKKSYFWLILSIGSIVNLMGQVVVDYYEMILGVKVPTAGWEHFFWTLSAVIFLISLVYKFHNKINKYPTLLLILDTMTVVCIAVALTWVYVILPNIIKVEVTNFLDLTFYIIYPVVDIGILFILTCYLFLKDLRDEKKSMSMIAAAFFVLLIANSAYCYLQTTGSYFTGSRIDPLWSMFAFLLSSAGLKFRKESGNEYISENQTIEYNKVFRFMFFLPGMSVILLFVLLFIKEDIVVWICSGISIILINIRQVTINLQNKALIKKLKALNETLETKVVERTEELFHLAFYDYLTNLPNRRFFENRLRSLMNSNRKDNSMIAVMFIDLDRFKYVNDTFGHSCGDLLLQIAAKRIEDSVDRRGIVCRQGGDEFAIIINGVEDKIDVKNTANKIISDLSRCMDLNGHCLHITCSIGIAIYPIDGNDYESIIKHADAAMYHSKEKGKNTYSLYCDKMDKESVV